MAALQEAGIVDIAPVAAGISISLLGIFPTIQSMAAQLAMLVAIAAGFFFNRRRAGRATE